MNAESSRVEYEKARSTLIQYLTHKVALCDWHGVSDAANDLRVLEAEFSGRTSQSGS